MRRGRVPGPLGRRVLLQLRQQLLDLLVLLQSAVRHPISLETIYCRKTNHEQYPHSPLYLFKLFFKLEVLLGESADFGVDVGRVGRLSLAQRAAQRALPNRGAHALLIARRVALDLDHLQTNAREVETTRSGATVSTVLEN